MLRTKTSLKEIGCPCYYAAMKLKAICHIFVNILQYVTKILLFLHIKCKIWLGGMSIYILWILRYHKRQEQLAWAKEKWHTQVRCYSMKLWRKRLWQIGLASLAIVILIFVVIFSGYERILPQWIKSMGPVVLFPLSTGCFGVSFAMPSMRGDKANINVFRVLIGILIFAVGCLLAFGWFAIGHPTW